jgi:hypothetical protein
MLDGGFPSGLHVHWRSEFVTSIPDARIEAAVSAFEKVPSQLSAVLFEQFGGAVSRVPGDATAFDQRDSDYNLVIVSRWADPADADRSVAWARSTSDAAKPFTTGASASTTSVRKHGSRSRRIRRRPRSRASGGNQAGDPKNVFT